MWSSEIRCSSQFRRAHDILPRPFGYPGTGNRIQLCGVLWTTGSGFSTWSIAKHPRIFAHATRDEAILESPEYNTRCEAMAADPWAVVLSLCHSVKFLLPRALGMHMRPICPRCNACVCHCSNAFATTCFPQVVFKGLAWHSEAVPSTNRTGILIFMGTSTLLVFTNTRP